MTGRAFRVRLCLLRKTESPGDICANRVSADRRIVPQVHERVVLVALRIVQGDTPLDMAVRFGKRPAEHRRRPSRMMCL